MERVGVGTPLKKILIGFGMWRKTGMKIGFCFRNFFDPKSGWCQVIQGIQPGFGVAAFEIDQIDVGDLAQSMDSCIRTASTDDSGLIRA